MRVLGIDPGTHRCGAGFIDGEGNRYKLVEAFVIKTKATAPIEARLYQVFSEIKRLIAEFKPDVLALEGLFYAKDIQAVVRIGEARACAMLAAQENKLPIFEYAPTAVKQSVTGNGRATKEQVQFMVTKLLNLKEMPYADSVKTQCPRLLSWRRLKHQTLQMLVPPTPLVWSNSVPKDSLGLR